MTVKTLVCYFNDEAGKKEEISFLFKLVKLSEGTEIPTTNICLFQHVKHVCASASSKYCLIEAKQKSPKT